MQPVQALQAPCRRVFEFIDMGFHFERSPVAERLQKAGDFGKPEMCLSRRIGIALDRERKDVSAVYAVCRSSCVLLLDEPVRQRDDLFGPEACGGWRELHFAFEPTKRTCDGPFEGDSADEGDARTQPSSARRRGLELLFHLCEAGGL